jgi:hypothetical protein
MKELEIKHLFEVGQTFMPLQLEDHLRKTRKSIEFFEKIEINQTTGNETG